MPHLASARESHIDRICRESHALWGGGLSLEHYREFWDELGRTAWARRHYGFHVWVDDHGEILSSFKLYRPRVRCLGRVATACVVGAVFTPAAHRRHGHAHEMLRQVLDDARRRGDGVSLLFSDIGTAYYEVLGYHTLPADEIWGRLPRHPTLPAGDWDVRPLTGDDLDTVVRIHDEWCASRPLAVLRDREHWEFLMVRAHGFFSRLGNASLAADFSVVLRDGDTVGYIVSVHGPIEWSIREVGACGGDAALTADVLRAGARQARALGMRKIYGWLPRSITGHLPEWRLRRAPRGRAIPMILALDGADLDALQDADASFLPYQDQF